MIQLTRNSPTNAYIAQKTALRENRVIRNRVMRGLGVLQKKVFIATCLVVSGYKGNQIPKNRLFETLWKFNINDHCVQCTR